MEMKKKNLLYVILASFAGLAIVALSIAVILLSVGPASSKELNIMYNSSKNGIKAFETLELGVDYDSDIKNPYDAEKFMMDALITLPDGSQETVAMFWYEGYNRTIAGDVENLIANSNNYWMLRYTPKSSGTYNISVQITKNGKVAGKTKILTQKVSSGSKDAFLRPSMDKTHLEFENGRAFNGIGHNLCGWEWAGSDNQAGTYDYDKWLTQLKANGANMAQFDLCEGDNIEWTKKDGELAYSDGYNGIGHYNQQAAWKADYKAKMCEDLGIYYRFSLYHWEDFDTEQGNFPDWGWSRNPYNSENGGPAKNVSEFFSGEESKQMTKNYIRYVAARWGYSPNMIMWELWNEADAPEIAWKAGMNYQKEEENIKNWHDEMAIYIKSQDINKHMVTTSFASSDNGNKIWKLESIDVTTFHRYSMYNGSAEGMFNGIKALNNIIKNRIFSYSKPVIGGEFALSPGGDIQRETDPDGIGFHNQIWASLFSGSFGSAMHWTWGSYLDRENLYYHYNGLSDFLRYEDLRNTKLNNNIDGTENYLFMSMAKKDRAFVWVKDRNYDYQNVLSGYNPVNMTNVPVLVSGLDNGAYTAFISNTYDNKAEVVSIPVNVVGGEASITLPDFYKDVAVKLIRDEQVYMSKDLDSGRVNNSTKVNGDTIRLYAAGSDIGGMSDAGRFSYIKVSGDFDYMAKVTKAGYLGEFSKAGIMIRQTESASSKMAFMGLNGAGDNIFISRNGSIATQSEWGKADLPGFVKLERRGKTIKGYYSADGVNFVEVSSITFSSINDELLVGVVASSKNILGYNDAIFENIKLIKR